jgi:hypothetical protein
LEGSECSLFYAYFMTITQSPLYTTAKKSTMRKIKNSKIYRHIVMKSLKRKPVLTYSHDDKKNLSTFVVRIVSLIIFVPYV